MKLKLTTVAFILCLASVFSANVSAVEVDVNGNGAGSENSANVSQNQSSTIHQSNFWNVFNRIFSRSTTGNNENSGGSTNTGSSTTRVNVTTTGNSNYAGDSCCGEIPQVPEFGLATGAITLFTSGGIFLFLKKRALKI